MAKQSNKPKKRVNKVDIYKLKYTILKLLKQGEGYTIDGLKTTLHVTKKQIKETLATLSADGFISSLKDNASGNTYFIEKNHLEKMKDDLAPKFTIDDEPLCDTSYIR
jgi:predicted transcriptional regulator